MPGALEDYLASQGSAARPLITALDRAVRSAYGNFDVAVKYRMLMYTIDGRWRNWVCAIGTTKDSVALRFLNGVSMEDPKGVLRAGTSILKTWDFSFDDRVDERAVKAYVRDAVSRHDAAATTPKARETTAPRSKR
jgi:hypothetical protein